MPFPNKEMREKCWGSRDKYWKCLDVNDNDQSKCSDEFKCFESECPKQWVQHFNRKRDYLLFKAKLETEADKLDEKE